MLTLLRHGLEETANVLHGWQDVDLVDKGVDQAKRAAEFMSSMRYRNAYTSDLKRASETAKYVAMKQDALVPTPSRALRSMNRGLLDGRPRAEVGEKVDALWASWKNGDHGLKAPDGESWDDFQGRVYPFLYKLQEEAQNSNVLAVTHSNVCDYAMGVFANGGRPLYGGALDLLTRFSIKPGQAVDFENGRITRLGYLP